MIWARFACILSGSVFLKSGKRNPKTGRMKREKRIYFVSLGIKGIWKNEKTIAEIELKRAEMKRVLHQVCACGLIVWLTSFHFLETFV